MLAGAGATVLTVNNVIVTPDPVCRSPQTPPSQNTNLCAVLTMNLWGHFCCFVLVCPCLLFIFPFTIVARAIVARDLHREEKRNMKSLHIAIAIWIDICGSKGRWPLLLTSTTGPYFSFSWPPLLFQVKSGANFTLSLDCTGSDDITAGTFVTQVFLAGIPVCVYACERNGHRRCSKIFVYTSVNT